MSNPQGSLSVTQQPAVADFINKLIDEKGFGDITSEVREELKSDLAERIDDFIMARVIAALDDKHVGEFEQMLKQGKPDSEIQTFITGNIPRFTDFLTNTLLEFKDVYLGVLAAPEAIVTNAPKPPTSPQNKVN